MTPPVDILLVAADASALRTACVERLVHPTHSEPLAKLDPEAGMVLAGGVLLDEIGVIYKELPKVGMGGEVLTPGVQLPGYHANLRITDWANPPPAFLDRLTAVAGGLRWLEDLDRGGKFYLMADLDFSVVDPDTVTSRTRVWA